MRFAIAAIALAVALSSTPVRAEERVPECDRLAASPLDPAGTAAGVHFAELNGPKAELACRLAVAAAPEIARYRYQLGRAFDRQDRFDEARAAYAAAAEAGYGLAMFALGKLIELGLGAPPDPAMAAHHYAQAMEAGAPHAAGDLAYLLAAGALSEPDLSEAARLYGIAAAAGDAWSQVMLGLLYERGDGVAQDVAEAVRLYRAAAEQGDALGQFNLGVMYERGTGVEQDFSAARSWYQLAFGAGLPLAAVAIGTHYALGLAVPRDLLEAERLYRIAMESGDPDARWRAENSLAWILAREGVRLEEARALALAALEAAPIAERAPILDTAALVELGLGDFHKALALVDEAIRLDPDSAPFHNLRGDVLAALGRRDEAVAAWQRALELPAPPVYADPDWDPRRIQEKL
jgi:uncharacterized protein